MKRFAIATLLGCGMLAMAPAMPTPIQNVVLTSASAGTYEDNVFRRGEPRAGGKPWHYEDRNRQYQGGMQQGGNFNQQGRQHFDTMKSGRVVHYRRLVAVRRVAGSAPMVQEQPRARCGGSCVTRRPACGSRCTVKPKCSTCGVAAPRQTNTSKVSGIKSVIKGDGNTVTQTVTVNQTNVYGSGVPARSTTSSTSRTCPTAQGARYIKTENGREVWFWNGQARLMKPKRDNTAVACVVSGTLGWTYASN